jgi:hypothetical protein
MLLAEVLELGIRLTNLAVQQSRGGEPALIELKKAPVLALRAAGPAVLETVPPHQGLSVRI